MDCYLRSKDWAAIFFRYFGTLDIVSLLMANNKS